MSVHIKARRILLPSAARTVATACLVQRDEVQQYCRVYLNVTAASGTGGLTGVFRGYDKVSGLPVALSAGGAAVTAAGMYVYEMMPYPSAPAGAVKETVGRMLPVVWDFALAVGDASSYTYSVSCEVMPG